jgi:serpin B
MRRAFSRPRIQVLVGACLLSIAASCGKDVTGPEPQITELPRPLTQTERTLVAASNTFAIDLLRQVHGASPDSTAFLSPLSASVALGMTMNGADGATRDQMRGMLGFGSLGMGEVDASYHDLLDLLKGLDSRVDLRIANAIFHDNEFQVKEPFLDTVRTFFDAQVSALDFGASSAPDIINGWVKGATGGRIDRIVDPPLDPNLVAVLLNAIYFKGDWSQKFDASDTYTGPFHLAGGGTQDIRLMKKTDTLYYRSTDRWQAVEVPYGGGAWVMTVVVPRDGASLDDVADDLTPILDPSVRWPKLEVELHLPRFQLSWDRVLNDDLKALGMVDAFSETAADFTPMASNARETQLHVGWVRQKTFLKVDEEGTTAAAVTGVGMIVTAAPLIPVVKADRPFFLAIRERLSGTVLFAGFIVQAPTDG